jgi:hypothetical protein
LHSELKAWEEIRNDEGASNDWQCDVDAARKKFTRAYEEARSVK